MVLLASRLRLVVRHARVRHRACGAVARVSRSVRRACGEVALFVAVAAAGAADGACGGGPTRGHPLDVAWDDESGAELAAFEEAFDAPALVAQRAAVARPVPGLFLGVTLETGADGDVVTVLGRAYAGARWAYQHPLDAPPWLAGAVVVGLGAGELFALDGQTGEPLWTRRVGGRLRGAADDGETTLVSLASWSGARSVVLALDRAGTVRRQLDVAAEIGVPAVAGETAFLPWRGEGVVIFDLLLGREVARVVTSEPASEARALGGRLFFGSGTRVLSFDGAVVAARGGGGTTTSLALPRLPEQPAWFGLAAREALGRGPRRWGERGFGARVHAYPGSERALLQYYRVAVSYPAAGGAPEWLYTSARDLLGGAASPAGFALCDAGGGAVWLGPDGAVRARASLGATLAACALSEEPPEAARALAVSPAAATPRGDAAASELLRALVIDDRRLLPLELELLAALDRLEGEAATEALIELTARELVHPAVRAAARERLARRPAGGAMLSALARRAAGVDWSARLPRELGWEPPVAILAEVLAAAHEDGARVPLARLLADGGLDDEALRAVALGLERLATPAERARLVAFALRTRCAPARSARADAFAAAARTLERLGADGVLAGLRVAPCAS